MTNKILSIQSKLVYGYVGSNIAELAIQLHGLDVIAFPTVYLSAHTGHQPSYGTKIEKPLFDDLITGIKNLNILDSVAHIISGYIGSEGILESAVDFITEIKQNSPDLLYICDPVMGDEEGLYINKELAQAIVDKLLPICDIMTPNHAEFNHIAGTVTKTKDEIVTAVANHPTLSQKTVVITSCNLEDTSEDKIETLIISNNKCTSIMTSRIDIDTTGTGDLFTAVTASRLALGDNVETSVNRAAEFVAKALGYTLSQNNDEMNAKSIINSI